MRTGIVLIGVLALAACKDEAVVLDAASVARGETVFESCSACHAIAQEENRIGPHLVEIVGRKAGAVDGYDYSAEMAGSGIDWTADQLKAFLLDPIGMVPGTKMALGEISDAEAVDVVAYMQSLQQ